MAGLHNIKDNKMPALSAIGWEANEPKAYTANGRYLTLRLTASLPLTPTDRMYVYTSVFTFDFFYGKVYPSVCVGGGGGGGSISEFPE